MYNASKYSLLLHEGDIRMDTICFLCVNFLKILFERTAILSVVADYLSHKDSIVAWQVDFQ